MAVSTQEFSEISKLSTQALNEIGQLLADIEDAIVKAYAVKKVLVAKLGFTPGLSCHFHIVPVHSWVVPEISADPAYADEPDGNDVMLYVNRKYCEQQNEEEASSVALNAIAKLAPHIL